VDFEEFASAWNESINDLKTVRDSAGPEEAQDDWVLDLELWTARRVWP
jgi:hypothetical protein